MAIWSEYFEEMGSYLLSLERQLGLANENFTEYAVDRLKNCIGSLTEIKEVLCNTVDDSAPQQAANLVLEEGYNVLCGDLLKILVDVLSIWRDYESNLSGTPHQAEYTAPINHSGRQGRPKFVISKSQLEYLRSAGFSWNLIASLLGVSRMTIYRRRLECGMLAQPVNALSDNDLVTVLREVKTDLPYVGEVILLGALQSRGYDVILVISVEDAFD